MLDRNMETKTIGDAKEKRDICKGLLASKRTVSFQRKDSLPVGSAFRGATVRALASDINT
jgi:hypothetical protein